LQITGGDADRGVDPHANILDGLEVGRTDGAQEAIVSGRADGVSRGIARSAVAEDARHGPLSFRVRAVHGYKTLSAAFVPAPTPANWIRGRPESSLFSAPFPKPAAGVRVTSVTTVLLFAVRAPLVLMAPVAPMVEDVNQAPSAVIAPIPVIAPVAPMSQSEELIATVPLLPPIATAPELDPVLMLVPKFDDALIEVVAPDTVAPSAAVKRPELNSVVVNVPVLA
jgi:hypothetical protein